MYLYVQVILIKSETGLNTQRIINNSWFIAVGGILGTIFGLMNLVSFFMNILEGVNESYNKKARRELTINTILQRVKSLSSEFGYYRVKYKNSKVVPVDMWTE